ncbi:DNA-binding response regulator [Tenacibaculum maritimum]|uniref:DNA-binding response regulator n=1 Tax=Tenacibaculum maritimum TaxID=107401 RepID=UPI0038775F2E
MFKKVLIAEDADFISSGVKIALGNLGIETINHAQYCDEAFLKLKKELIEDDPYELLISDLSFVDNPNPQRLQTGEDLIHEVKKIQPSIKTIVFSIEDKPYRIQELCNNLKIDAYVWKSIHGEKDLKRAVRTVFNDDFFISQNVAHALKKKENMEITDFDIFLLKSLANGLEQKEISYELKKNKQQPSSISTIEKRLKLLKEYFNANTSAQLIAITKDFGLI